MAAVGPAGIDARESATGRRPRSPMLNVRAHAEMPNCVDNIGN
jgi:hypothetical protein